MAAKEGRSFETSEREHSPVKNRILIDPAADRDLDEQFEYLATENPEVALRFLEAARVTFEQLA